MVVLTHYQKEFLKEFIVSLYLTENRYRTMTNYHMYKHALSTTKNKLVNISKYLEKPEIAYAIQMIGTDYNCYGETKISAPYLTFATDLNERIGNKLNKNYCKPVFINDNKHSELLTNLGKSYAKKLINKK